MVEMAKYCTRCNKGIYTAWRTLDEKKYYHPHCFTCAVCNVILECVQECGVPNLKEIYCKKCYKEILRGEKISRWYENPKAIGNSNNGQGEELMQFQSLPLHGLSFEHPESGALGLPLQPNMPLMFKQPVLQHGRTSFDLTFSQPVQQNIEDASSPPHHPHYHNHEHESQSNQADARKKAPLPLRNKFPIPPPPETFTPQNAPPQKAQKQGSKKVETEVTQECALSFVPIKTDVNNNPAPTRTTRRSRERQQSRIPRPTSSSLSKKSLLAVFAPPEPGVQGSKSKPKIKPSKNQLPITPSSKIIVNSRSRPPAAPPKMQRSASVVQPRASKMNAGVRSQQSNAKPSKSFSHPRTTTTNEQQLACANPRVPQTVNSKRQCAASFSNSHHQPRSCQAEGTRTSRKPSDIYVQDQAYYKQTKYEVPTAQTILSVMRKERSDLNKAPTTSLPVPVPCTKVREDENGNRRVTTPPMSKRNYNITFDCPICISSLVPGTSNDGTPPASKIARGNVVTICGHLFHRECMENWLKIKGNKRCPICSSLCLPETLQPVYLECNVSAELGTSKQPVKESPNFVQANKNISSRGVDSAYLALRYEHDQLKRKYNSMLQDKTNHSLNVTIANSLQNAYDMECRNRLQLQWENKRLQQQIQELLRSQQQ